MVNVPQLVAGNLTFRELAMENDCPLLEVKTNLTLQSLRRAKKVDVMGLELSEPLKGSHIGILQPLTRGFYPLLLLPFLCKVAVDNQLDSVDIET